MPLLRPDDRLPLTCTREGACCIAPTVWINPWELAVLARHLGLEPRAARQRLTDAGGLRLRHDGPAAADGRPTCTLYRPGHGCSAHPGRPLACRLYPLGRARLDGQPAYHHPGGELPCLASCPGVRDLPALTVADYLAGQDVALAERAHDAWAARCYGVGVAAGSVARQAPDAAPAIRAALAAALAREPAARADLPGPGWTDVLTLMPPEAVIERPEEAVDLHALAIAGAVAARLGNDLAVAGSALAGLAARLAPVVGADPQVLTGLVG